uniref:Ubiquitin-like protease family profile domain-containing protein n=1 Tax=Ditylenchus dipsaci TaxID=166011 RepID=A0A915DPH5_9BILA
MFHYCQAVLHCIKDLGKGMINRYKEDELFRLLIRASELLALEEDKILIRCFVSYFGIQWLSKPLHVWNFYREDTRTNNAAEAYHSFLKKLRHGALRRPGNSLLFAFLQNLQFQQSVRVVRIESGASVKKKNRKYEKINDQLWESWKEFDIKARDRKSVDITTHCKEFLTIASHLVSDVNKTGLRTKKAERAAKNRKKRATDPVPVKEKKPKKESRKSTATIDVTGLGLDRVLANRFGIRLRQRDLNKLEPGQCLNDDIINYYLQLVAERSSEKVFALSSLLYTQLVDKGPSSVLKWTKDVDLFFFDVLLLPIHLPGHWTLAVVLNRRKRIDYYDSMGGNGAQHMEQVK